MNGQDNVIIGALEKCTSRDSIEDVFSKFQLENHAEKIEKLNEAMGNPQTFFSSRDIPVEDKYELTVQMFLSMSWKLSSLYDRIGVANNVSI